MFIQQIQSLDIETQAGIANCIQQVCSSVEFFLIKNPPNVKGIHRLTIYLKRYCPGETLLKGIFFPLKMI